MKNKTANTILIELEKLIATHPDLVLPGSSTDAATEDWIKKAEQQLGHKPPEPYKWFLRNCADGEIGAEETYSIYGIDFDNINGGEIIYQHITGLKNRSTTDTKVVISETDLGEVFFLDYNTCSNQESQIFLRCVIADPVLATYWHNNEI